MTTCPYVSLVKNIKTKNDVNSFVLELGDIVGNVYKVKPDEFVDYLHKNINPGFVQDIENILENSKIPLNNSQDVSKILLDLKESLKNVSYIKLILAFEPEAEFIGEIFEWVRKNVGNYVFLDLEKDESIVGGAVIIYNGKYIDMSLAKVLEEKREDVQNIFDEVLNKR